MVHQYPHQLSYGANNAVVALTEKEVGKLFGGDTRSDIGSEAEKMKYANSINELVVRFIRLDTHEPTGYEMLVMERLYPIDFRAYEYEKRQLWFEVFTDELTKLHTAGFVHRDIQRPASISGEIYDNVFLTERGLRLIDVGISALHTQVGDSLFEKFVRLEQQEMKEFGKYFLER
ncbi:MAG: hypothetical protein JST20_13995 [Bacteroidetes bacterium]|nr:hypothetical protein [Bacteroidota bacterium]